MFRTLELSFDALLQPALYLIEKWGRRRSLLVGAVIEAICALIAGLVGHYTLAPTGTPPDQLTHRNKQGGDVLIAFAVLQGEFDDAFHLLCLS